MASRTELYEKFGQTAEAAQLFETDLGTLLLVAEGSAMGWHIKPDKEAASRFYQQMTQDTLGRLLKKVKARVALSDDVDQKFSNALRARNRLNHGFFERHNFKIQTAAGRDEIIADLEELHTVLFEAWQIAQSSVALITDVVLRESK